MSSVRLSGNASGTGIFTIASPNSNTDYTLTLPTATTTLVGTDATQTLTNKTIQGGAITSGTAVASTSGTSIDFTSIPSWVKRITVMFNGVSTNGTSNPLIQIGAGSVTTTGYSAYSKEGGSTGAVYTTGFGIQSSSTVNALFGHFVLTQVSGNTWVASSVLAFTQSSIGFTITSGGGISLGGTLDRVRITTETGTNTFDAGTINILYE
jgi:hypothetical protein